MILTDCLAQQPTPVFMNSEQSELMKNEATSIDHIDVDVDRNMWN